MTAPIITLTMDFGNSGHYVETLGLPGLVRTHQDGVGGEPVALIGSSGYLGFAVVQGSAGAQPGVGRGERVRLTPGPAS